MDNESKALGNQQIPPVDSYPYYGVKSLMNEESLSDSTSTSGSIGPFESEPFEIDFGPHATDAASLKSKRLRANDRERRRVNLINSAMETLRNVVPVLRERRKTTKLELLRCANRYIWLLNQSLLTGKTPQELEEIQFRYPAALSSFSPQYFTYGYQQQHERFY